MEMVLRHTAAVAPARDGRWDTEYAELPPFLERHLEQCGCALLRNALVCDAAQTLRAYHRVLEQHADSARACSYSMGLDLVLARSRCTDCATHPDGTTAWAANLFANLEPVIESARERGISAIVLISPCFADRDVAEVFRDEGLRRTGYSVYAFAPPAAAPAIPSPNALEMTAHLPIRYRVVNVDRPIFDLSNLELKRFVDGRSVFVVADERVMDTYGESMTAYFQRHTHLTGLMTMQGDEAAKHWNNVDGICARAFESHLGRSSLMVGVGGGIVMDVVGVAASLYRRGIAYLRIPTTLIGMVDVAVGIKHGVNFGGKKNALGTFYPPAGAVSDRRFLATLDERYLLCGLAEILKLGLVCDPALFRIIEEYGAALLRSRFTTPAPAADDLIVRAQAAMMRELQHNLFEQDKRRLADFGHTISPALEAASQYRIHHGEAVALDMLFSSAIARVKGLLSASDFTCVQRLYANLGLPAACELMTPQLVFEAFEETRRHRGGKLNLVVPARIGKGAFVQTVRPDEVASALSTLGGRAT